MILFRIKIYKKNNTKEISSWRKWSNKSTNRISKRYLLNGQNKSKTKIFFTIECVAPFDLEGVKIPARNILPDRCPFLYQGAGDHVDNFKKHKVDVLGM